MKLGFIGTGLMGKPIVLRLQAAGYETIAYNRTAAKLVSLQEAGIATATEAIAVVRQADIIFSILTDAGAIRETILNDRTLALLFGKTIIQMGTISPLESQEMAAAVTAAGGEYVEAPVLGSIPEATAGTLIVMVGGTVGQYDRLLPILGHLGTSPKYIGDVGKAAALKLALNYLIASLTTGFAASLGYIRQWEIDTDDFMGILRDSALYAPTFDKKLDRMLKGNYDNPNFPTQHLLKDTLLFADSSDRLDTTISRSIAAILARTIETGFATADYSSLFETIKDRSSEGSV